MWRWLRWCDAFPALGESRGVQEICALVDTLIRQPSLKREYYSTKDQCGFSPFYLEPLLRDCCCSQQHSVLSNFATPWTAAHQASLSITNSQNLLKFMSIESVMPSSHLILCCPVLLLQSFPASGCFPMSQFFTSGGQSTRASASASVLPMNIQDWFPLRLTLLISLHSEIVITFL